MVSGIEPNRASRLSVVVLVNGVTVRRRVSLFADRPARDAGSEVARVVAEGLVVVRQAAGGHESRHDGASGGSRSAVSNVE
jgi:hypothetical protein